MHNRRGMISVFVLYSDNTTKLNHEIEYYNSARHVICMGEYHSFEQYDQYEDLDVLWERWFGESTE